MHVMWRVPNYYGGWEWPREKREKGYGVLCSVSKGGLTTWVVRLGAKVQELGTKCLQAQGRSARHLSTSVSSFQCEWQSRTVSGWQVTCTFYCLPVRRTFAAAPMMVPPADLSPVAIGAGLGCPVTGTCCIFRCPIGSS